MSISLFLGAIAPAAATTASVAARNTSDKYLDFMSAPLSALFSHSIGFYRHRERKASAKAGKTIHLLMDLIKVIINTAETSIRPPAAIRPRATKTMVAEFA